jgi:hypothetical protein
LILDLEFHQHLGSLKHAINIIMWVRDGGFYNFDPKFARDSRIVRLGLSTDGFHPYSSNSIAYSCWLVFVMPYNLPPNKCLKERFIFLSFVIPGPKEPKKQMNIFLRTLMEQLKELWQRVYAYDSYLKC